MADRQMIFGDFCLEPQRRELKRLGKSVRMEKIPFDLLILLVERAGDLVRREEITDKLWGPGVFQDVDASLNTAVRKLRMALRDNPERPQFIQTVVGQGYRFAGDVEIRDPEAGRPPSPADAAPAPAARVSPRRNHRLWLMAILAAVLAVPSWFAMRGWLKPPDDAPIIAVLPFEDFEQEAGRQYFSQGMTEEIITQLGRAVSSGVGVIAGPSVWRYRGRNPAPQQLRAELGAGYILSGSIRREGGTLRITARLVRTRDGVQIWTDAFDRDAGGVLAMEQDVAISVARAVASQFRGDRKSGLKPPPRLDPEAYDLYLRGRFYWNQRNESSLKLAMDYFRQALARAPDYAPAYAALADCYAMLVYGCYLAPTEGFSQARAALARARSLDAGSPEMLASEGYLSMYFDWDFDAAEREFEEALKANPNYASAYDWMGVLFTAEEKPALARRALEAARRHDPGSLPIATDLGFHFHYSGHDKEAEEILRKVLSRDPNFGLAHFWMGRVLNAEGDCTGALAELAQAPAQLQQWQPLVAARGYVEGRCGESARARTDLSWFEETGKTRFVTSYGIALIEAGLGDKEAALMWLRKAAEERSHWMVWIRLDPRFNAIRGDPRFQELVAKVFSKRQFR